MSTISEIVNVSVTIEEGAAPQAGFTTPLLIGRTALLGDTILSCSSAQDWLDAGGASSDEEYLALVAAFSQKPCQSTIKVAYAAADTASIRRIVFASDFQSGGTVAIAFSYTSIAGGTVTDSISVSFTADHATTVAAVETALAAKSFITAVSSATTGPGARFDITFSTSLSRSGDVTISSAAVTGTGAQTGTVSQTQAQVTISDRLSELLLIDSAVGYVLLTHTGTDAQRSADIYRLAANVEASAYPLIHIAQVDQSTLPSGGAANIAKILKAAGFNRTCLQYHAETEYLDMALVSRVGCQDLDVQSLDWYLFYLVGITVSTLNRTQRAALDADYIGYYVLHGARGAYRGGRMSSGRYLDEQLTVDWTQYSLQAEIYAFLAAGAATNKKRTYSDATVSQITGVIQTVYSRGVRAAHYADVYTDAIGNVVTGLQITAGRVSAESSSNKTARKYAGLSVSIKLAGSMRSVNPLTVTLEV